MKYIVSTSILKSDLESNGFIIEQIGDRTAASFGKDFAYIEFVDLPDIARKTFIQKAGTYLAEIYDEGENPKEIIKRILNVFDAKLVSEDFYSKKDFDDTTPDELFKNFIEEVRKNKQMINK